MTQEYTLEQLAVQMAALGQMFDEVVLVDPAKMMRLDPKTLEPTEPAETVPPLDASGRAWMPLCRGENVVMVFYQAIRVGMRPCVLAGVHDLPQTMPANSREANAFLRLLAQYREELRHDYVTGVYNRSFLDASYRNYIMEQAGKGEKVSAVVARVNEYGDLCSREGAAAADRCLNTAAGILQIAVGLDQDKSTLVRLEDGIFLVVSVGTDARTMADQLRHALDNSRRCFNITLSRRSEFTVKVAGVDWAETGNWDLMLSLAMRRL